MKKRGEFLNIVKESYVLGSELNNIDIGKKTKLLYNEIEQKISEEGFRILNKSRPVFQHYYAYPNAFEVLKANRDNNKLPENYLKNIKDVLNSNTIHDFRDQCIKLGNSIEKTATNLLSSKNIVKKFTNIETTPRARRTLQELYVKIRNTGLVREILKNPKLFANKISEYERLRNETSNIPFNREIRKLINNLSGKLCDKNLLFTMETMISLLQIIKQVIFEAHLDIIYELTDNDIKTVRLKKYNNFFPFIINLNEHNLDIMNSPNLIIKLSNNNEENFGLIKRRTLTYEKGSSFEIKIRGILYPSNDFKF